MGANFVYREKNMKERGIIILNKEFNENWLPLLREGGYNKLGLHSLYPYGGMEWHMNWLLKKQTRELIDKFENAGIAVEQELHSVDWLLPRSLFSCFPQWFRMNESGERVGDWNFCVSNEEALEYVELSAYKYALLLRQTSHNYFLWSDDKRDMLCHCEKCRHLNGADQNMRIMKSILRGLKRYDPQAKLSFLAYDDSLALPTEKPDKDMFLEFAPIRRNHLVPIDGDDESNRAIKEMLLRLLKIFPAESARVLEYFLDVSLFCDWDRNKAAALPFDESRVRRDLEFYRSAGIERTTTFAVFMDDEWRREHGTADLMRCGRAMQEI